MTRTVALGFAMSSGFAAGCAASPAPPPASEYVWSTPHAGDTRDAHIYGEPAPATPVPTAAASQPVPDAPPGSWAEQQGAPATTSGTPWVESSDPRWTTHRIAAPEPEYEASAPVVTYAPTPVYVNSYPGPWGYGPGYYGPYYSRPFIGVGIGIGGFRGGGFHGGFGGGFHGGFRGGSHGWGHR